jgi:DNA topoisomerase-2
MARNIRTERNVDDYKEMDELEHILARPDTYVGSVEPETRTEMLLNLTERKLYMADIKLPQAVERLFLEILSNAGDNADNSRRCGVDPGAIHIYMDRNWIKIRNEGEPIPIEESKSTPGKLIPDVIFGKLRSSSNYDPNVILMGAGKNGFGAKLTNVYSKTFVVNIGNAKTKKHYQGTWNNNMSEGPKTEVKEGYTGFNFVEISWLLDFGRFKIEGDTPMKEYPDEAFGLFARYAADFSLTCKIPIMFSMPGNYHISLDVRNIRDYALLKWDEELCNKSIIHYEWPGRDTKNPNGVSPIEQKGLALERAIAKPARPDHIPIIEMMILDTPDDGMSLSYVNGMYTMDGGVHLNEAFSNITSEINEIINVLNKSRAKENKLPRVTVDDIRAHISIILNCRLPDPKYTSQSKTRLASPKPHIAVPEKLVATVKNWQLINRLIIALEAKMYAVLKKTNGGRRKHIHLEAGEDANLAGTDQSDKCVLYLVEGKSASAYPKKRITYMEEGKDLGGYYPLRGKFMNVRNASQLNLAENKEVRAIKNLMGLREGVDYSKPEEIATLRYGHIMICVDADSDGFHIASLLINYINEYFSGLLVSGRVAILRTPVVRVFDGKKLIGRFYNTHEFDEWEKKANADGTLKGTKIVYYKGLGKSDDEEIRDDLKTAPVVTIVYDDSASESLTLAFDKTMADSRKTWIAKWREVGHIYDVDFIGTGVFRQQHITNFINRELIDYTKDALFRAIPCFEDGLKRSHRQALYAALKYFRYGHKNELIGVSRFANYAANETNYHHGETSMCDTVVKMTQDYIGSNNLPWFKGKGQFGTRAGDEDGPGGDAASPRYLSVNLPKYAKYLYDEELINCIPRRVVETDEVEPIYVPATIPMHLINGVIGIATGYSTFIPNFNYYDIINWCKLFCVGELTKQSANEAALMFKPWYRGFKGTIQTFTRGSEEDSRNEIMKTIGETSEDKLIEEDEEDAKTHKKGIFYKTYGIGDFFDKNDNKADMIIKEIPIGIGIYKYRKWLELLLKERKISDFRDKSSTEYPYFEVKGYNKKDNPKITLRNMHLAKSATMNNVIMIDAEGYPRKFNNIVEVVEVYADRMIRLYQAVKDQRINNLTEKINDMQYRIQFIQAVVNDKIKIVKRSKADILADMAKQKPAIPERYLNSVRASEFTLEEIEESRQEMEKAKTLMKETLSLKPENLWYEKLIALESYLRKEGY